MNKSISWLYAQSVETSQPSGNASCYLCAMTCSEEHTVARGIADTFNSHYLALCPSSPYLCAACRWYFDGKSAHPDFRKMSLIVAEHVWRNWERAKMKSDIIQWLICGLDADAYLVVSLSKKKHILLQAPLNTQGSHQLSIQVEEQVAHVDLISWQVIERPFLALLAMGHGKGEILSGELHTSTLRKHGCIAGALSLSRRLEQWRKSPLIELYSYVTIIDEKGTVDDGLGIRPDGGTANIPTTGTRRATNSLPTGIRALPNSGGPSSGRVERDRSRLSEQVSRHDLDAIRRESGNMQSDHEQFTLFPE